MVQTPAQKKRANREKMRRYRQRKKLSEQNVGIPPHLQFRKLGRPPKVLTAENNPIMHPSLLRPLPIISPGRGSVNNAHYNAKEKITVWANELEAADKSKYKSMKTAMSKIIEDIGTSFRWLRSFDESCQLFHLKRQGARNLSSLDGCEKIPVDK